MWGRHRSMPDSSSTASWGSSAARMLEVATLEEGMLDVKLGLHAVPAIGGIDAPPPAFPVAGDNTEMVESLLDMWIRRVITAETDFSSYAPLFIGGFLPTSPERCRDVLPVPQIIQLDITEWKPTIDKNLVWRLLNLAGAALNFMFLDGDRAAAIPATTSARHRSVIRHACSRIDDAITELMLVEEPLQVEGSFEGLSTRKALDKFPKLRLADVDVPAVAGNIDPLDFVWPEAQELFEDPLKLLPVDLCAATHRRTSREPHSGDQVSLVIRLLRLGKLHLVKFPRAVADTFFIEKAGTQRLWEIWSGGLLTRLAAQPEKPPMLASPASLANLEATDDVPQWISTRDGTCFFDQLRVPDHLCPFFRRPSVLIAHLLQPPICESGAQPELPLTPSDLDRLFLTALLKRTMSGWSQSVVHGRWDLGGPPCWPRAPWSLVAWRPAFGGKRFLQRSVYFCLVQQRQWRSQLMMSIALWPSQQ